MNMYMYVYVCVYAHTCVHRGRVGVPKFLGKEDGRLDLCRVHGLGELHERLLQLLVFVGVLRQQ